MLPSPPLTEPDVPISSIRFFTGELRSQRCIDGRSGRKGEGVASGLRQVGSMGTCPVDPFATTTSARCARLGWRTSAVVVHYLLCRSRHSGPASSRSDERAARGSACAGFPDTSRLLPPVHERNVSLPSLATPRSCPCATFPIRGRSRER